MNPNVEKKMKTDVATFPKYTIAIGKIMLIIATQNDGLSLVGIAAALIIHVEEVTVIATMMMNVKEILFADMETVDRGFQITQIAAKWKIGKKR